MKIYPVIEESDKMTKLSEFVSNIVPPKIGEVWLYGSRARGDFSLHSDWDILILLNNVSSDDKDFAQYAYPLIEFGWKHDMELNPLIFSKNNWINHPKNLFHYNVQKDRIRL